MIPLDYQPDPAALHRIIQKLHSAGWLADGTNLATVGDETTGTVNFNKLGSEHVKTFYLMHQGLWDLDPHDLFRFHTWLTGQALMLAQRDGQIDHG